VRSLIVSSLLLLLTTSAAFSEEVLREISWAKLEEAGQLQAGEIVGGDDASPPEQLKVDHRQSEPDSVALLVIEEPGVRASQYALTGKVRYEDVEGTGYLEMWNCFPDGGKYFTRTLASHGLLRSLEGSSDWRDFSLPFIITEGHERPERLIVNLTFDGAGTVYLGPLCLVEYADGEDPLAVSGAWCGDRTAGLVGGIAGAVFGCLGGLIGILAGKGKARRLVMGLTAAIVPLGVAIFAAGVVALVLKQPYCVYYPLLLLGGLSAVIMAPMRRSLRHRYEQIELRKMEAMDIGGR